MTKFTAIDAFCGAGGLAAGLERAGFITKAAFDVDGPAVTTFNRNVRSVAFVTDARELSGHDLLEHAGLELGQLDLFAGGPPCQGFSRQKRGAHLGDDRNTLVVEFARLVVETRPRFFMLENVDQLGQKRGKAFVDRLAGLLPGYLLYSGFHNSADFGLAQTRRRFVLVGRDPNLTARYYPPAPTVSAWTTVDEALAGIPEPPNDYSEHPHFANHQAARVTAENIRRFSHVPQGGGWQNIPEEFRLDCHKGVDPKAGGWPDVYGRLRANGQAPTITGGFDSFTRGRYGHPHQDRPITPREAARLQGFPDEFVFEGNRGEVRSQIGNAVPPPLAEAFGTQIRKSLAAFDNGEVDLNDRGFELALLLQTHLPWESLPVEQARQVALEKSA